jgi:hypothetical protein
MWGLAIGAAMGGGIAALQHKDVLTGALMGGATGALGGALAPAALGSEVAVASAVPAPAPIAGSVLPEASAGITSLPSSGVTVNGTSLLGNQVPSAMGSLSTGAAPLSGVVPSQTIADTSSALSGTSAASNAGKGFFDSGIGKWVAENPGKTALGVGALGLTAFKPSSSSGGAGQKTSYIRPYKYSQTENPEYAGAGTPYFKQSYTAQEPVNANDWGTRTTMADGGIAGLAQGGQQSGLSQQDNFLGQNAIYPTSHIDHTQYATSSQLPTSAAIRDSDYDTPTTPYAGQEYTRMAEGGEAEAKEAPQAVALPAAQQQGNPTLAALMAIQQAQTPQVIVPQGITQPMIQPELAQIQQHYATPQRQAPEAFQYQQPAFVKYGNAYTNGTAGGAGGAAGVAGAGGAGAAGIAALATKKAAASPASSAVAGDSSAPQIAEVYDYANNTPTRPYNPTSGSPEFNIPSNVPVDPSSGLAAIQQRYANMGYTDYVPSATNTDQGAANGGLMPQNLQYAMGGGIGDLGSYSDGGRLLKGPGDGVSDSIPAQIGRHQPARLADGEFVIPARIVSELGNGSTDAGAKRLYAMMDRIQNNRRKTVGKGKVAVNSKSDKYLPA